MVTPRRHVGCICAYQFFIDITLQKWHILWNMLHRLLSISKSSSFFLFGARGTGKSTIVRDFLRALPHVEINLLRAQERISLQADPDSLESRITAGTEWVFIDEVQKVPAVLDTVHRLIEDKGVKFALSGSSARKLKAGGANLLAGRAFVNELYPLTSLELGSTFDLNQALSWGMLPKLLEYEADRDKKDYLEAYTVAYLQEEIWEEHLVKNLLPFRKFLQVAAQSNGKIINYSNIADDVRVDTKTVQQYFQILEETLLCFFLEPYHASLRKRQRSNPKFYLIDIGIWRALANNFVLGFTQESLGFGNLFEHFLILEIRALSRYRKNGYQFYFIRKDNKEEVDLIIERPGRPLAMIEIKSHANLEERHVQTLNNIGEDYPQAELFCFSLDPHEKLFFNRVRALYWREGLEIL